MERSIPVNSILKEEVNKLNYTMIPEDFKGGVREVRQVQECLTNIIDTLGEQSADAQGLNKVITTAEKLRNAPSHVLYLIKDVNANDGNGEVVGMLKVGRKHLFLFDENDQVCEVEPLCVLDFYVQRDRQRHGFGRTLFDYMLQDNDTTPYEIAIDGPSPKMEQFLERNYGVDKLMHQNNNFAVAPQFFLHTDAIRSSACSTPAVTPAVGRFAAPKPASAIANVIHGTGAQYRPKSSGRSSTITSPAEEEPSSAPAAQPSPQPPQPPQAEPKDEPSPAADSAAAAEQHKSPERPSSLHVEPAAVTAAGAEPAGAEPSPAGSAVSRRDSQLTDQGFFDVKFYHNKLW